MSAGGALLSSQAGAANDVAQLGAISQVPIAQLPVGSTAGTVASGAALAAEIMRAEAAESANASAIGSNATAIANETTRATAAEAAKAPLASPSFTGTAIGRHDGGITQILATISWHPRRGHRGDRNCYGPSNKPLMIWGTAGDAYEAWGN